MKNEKPTVFRFPLFYENKKRMKALKIERKNLCSQLEKNNSAVIVVDVVKNGSQLFEFSLLHWSKSKI